MHRTPTVSPRLPWPSLLPATLLVLAVACGEPPAEAPKAE